MAKGRQRPTEAIIFDVEGTLIDCVPLTLQCWQELLHQFQCQAARPALQQYVGYDGGEMLDRLFHLLAKSKKQAILRGMRAFIERSILSAPPHLREFTSFSCACCGEAFVSVLQRRVNASS